MRLSKSIHFVLLAALLVPAAAVVTAENGRGVISGTVRLVGLTHVIPVVEPSADSEGCGSAIRLTQSLLLGSNQVVRDVIIYLAGYVSNGVSHGTNDAVTLDQRNCEFVPRIQFARSGTPLILRNSDPFLHVLHIESLSGTNGPKTLLKAATPYAGYTKMYQLANFREPTLLRVTSGNGNSWMAAYIAVMPHPWAALTDENGRFTIHDVPSGTHKIYAWHEVLGTQVRNVRVNDEHTTTADFQFTSAH